MRGSSPATATRRFGIVTTTSVPPLGDTSFPTDARVYRWSDDGFTITDTPEGKVKTTSAKKAKRHAGAIREGVTVDVEIPPAAPSTVEAEEIPLTVLHDDSDLPAENVGGVFDEATVIENAGSEEITFLVLSSSAHPASILAGLRVAQAVAGDGISISGPNQSRVDLVADVRGVVRVNAALVRSINEAPSMQRACQTLINAANAAGGPDNISVILVQLIG